LKHDSHFSSADPCRLSDAKYGDNMPKPPIAVSLYTIGDSAAISGTFILIPIIYNLKKLCGFIYCV
jgi:hypothetical protein